ncbi:MAG: MurT ligase domain-containing protein [Hydrogenoanaerobacterium sp.]
MFIILRFKLALALGKLIHFFGKFVGKATNLPGDFAMKLCPQFLGQFSFKGKVIAVTGSNGKTTTANMLAFILTQQGYSVANNAKGSNLTGGIATTLLTSSHFSGAIDEDFVVLEVDERFSRLIFKLFSPDYLVCTNLFRDQLTRNGNIDVIIEKLHEAIKPTVKLILNANDPISGNLSPKNPRVYYGMERTSQSEAVCQNLTHDAKVCPKCLGRMNYDYFHYNHIGSFLCTSCGYKTPASKYLAADVNFETGNFTINGTSIYADYRPPFNILNMTAAVAACCEVGVPLEKACASASQFKVMKQRYDEFKIGERTAVMILSKNQNPVSFDQSISYVLEMPGEKTVVAYVNNINHTGHRDTTWLYDISFERLVDNVSTMVCTGPRAYDLAVRLKLAGFAPEDIKTECDVARIKPIVDETSGTICVLTELYDANAILEVISK